MVLQGSGQCSIFVGEENKPKSKVAPYKEKFFFIGPQPGPAVQTLVRGAPPRGLKPKIPPKHAPKGHQNLPNNTLLILDKSCFSPRCFRGVLNVFLKVSGVF